MLSPLRVPVLVLAFATPLLAQSIETVLSSVVFTRHGERTPILNGLPLQLTPLGAQNLYAAGAFFRDRYFDAGNGSSATAIFGLAQNTLNNSETYISTPDSEFITGSAQAFLQSVYPPIDPAKSPVLSPDAVLANGSYLATPLGGYQYPLIQTYSVSDPNYVWLSGSDECDNYNNAVYNYLLSADLNNTQTQTNTFYQSLIDQLFRGKIPAPAASYLNANALFEYADYANTHNQSVHSKLVPADLDQLRVLSDRFSYAITSPQGGDNILTIAGQTLLYNVAALLKTNALHQGRLFKLNLLFGSFDPMMAAASLLQLPSSFPDFYGTPQHGSSLVFELFTLGAARRASYPANMSGLRVRFLFRNGTAPSTPLSPFPIFGAPSVTWDVFMQELEKISQANNPASWCNLCNSTAFFCRQYQASTVILETPNASGTATASSGKSLSPAVGGIIGAVVALAVAGLIFAAAMLLGGLRIQRRRAPASPGLGGFKGAEKLASDTDLSVPRYSAVMAAGAGGAGAGIMPPRAGPVQPGHERVGSWELREHGFAGLGLGEGVRGGVSRPVSVVSAVSAVSAEDDEEALRVNPFGDPVRVEDHV
ncbi:MAG: hypothetical protein M1829_004386 [Trizodia sp. TS-e1964]|nr:MAG: hypothetical protein M1829_004386 [Trizodia sp. TS-e1964]